MPGFLAKICRRLIIHVLVQVGHACPDAQVLRFTCTVGYWGYLHVIMHSLFNRISHMGSDIARHSRLTFTSRLRECRDWWHTKIKIFFICYKEISFIFGKGLGQLGWDWFFSIFLAVFLKMCLFVMITSSPLLRKIKNLCHQLSECLFFIVDLCSL